MQPCQWDVWRVWRPRCRMTHGWFKLLLEKLSHIYHLWTLIIDQYESITVYSLLTTRHFFQWIDNSCFCPQPIKFFKKKQLNCSVDHALNSKHFHNKRVRHNNVLYQNIQYSHIIIKQNVNNSGVHSSAIGVKNTVYASECGWIVCLHVVLHRLSSNSHSFKHYNGAIHKLVYGFYH